MKCFVLWAFIASALAQGSSNSSSSSNTTTSEETTTITEYYPDCSTLPVTSHPSNGTITGTVTQTLPCPECAKTTTYTTVYQYLCPTGLAPTTYTITEPCTETGSTRPSSYIPQGFTVATVACDVCAQETVTLTKPAQTTAPAATITPVPANSSTICHTCNQTATSIYSGGAGTATSMGLSAIFFSFVAGGFFML